MPTSHPPTVSTTVAGKSFTASASPPQSNLVERVYRIIDDLCLKASGPVWLSQKELAQTLEVTPRTVNRVISRLKQSGRLIVTKTGADLSYMTAKEPAQLPLVSAITAAPSNRSRSSGAKAATSPEPMTVDGQTTDTHGTDDGPTIDDRWTADGQRIDQQWTADGQPMDRQWATNSQPMDNKWSDDRQPIVADTTTDSQPVDSPETCDGQPIGGTEGNWACSIWEQALTEISSQLPPGAFQDFFAPTVGIRLEGDVLVVAVQNSRLIEWLERSMHLEIAQTALEHVAGRYLRLRYLEDPTRSAGAQHHIAPAGKAPLTSPELTDCPRCGPDTMVLTTWPSLKRLSGRTYYCRAAGECSRLWNSVVGEFHPAGEKQLNPEAARDLLRKVLKNRPRSHH